MRLRRRLRAVILGSAMAGYATLGYGLFTSTVARAAADPSCPELGASYQAFRFSSTVSHNGALAGWQIRDIRAPDWPDNGHANATLWFGTDGDLNNTWIEVGVMWGFNGDNALEFYGTKRYPSSSGYVYKKHLFAMPAAVGQYVTFKVIKTSSGDMRASVTDETTLDQETWTTSTNAGPFDEWQIGAEYTCSAGGSTTGSFIHMVHVYDNEYRRTSDSSWVYPDSGYSYPGYHGTGGNVAWCYQNILFRFWVHDSDRGCI
jgi:hypothetical protein